MRLERDEVARRLGVDEHAERSRASRGSRDRLGWFGGQLQEAADRCAALVQLAGGVQEARPEANGHGAAGPVAQQRAAISRSACVALRRRRDVSLEREVAVAA